MTSSAPVTREPDVQELLDERAIRAVVLRYCRGVDRMDRDLVRSCYHPDATDSHGSFEGPVDEFIPWVFRILARYTLTMHFVGNLLVEAKPGCTDVARAETYGIAFHRTDGHTAADGRSEKRDAAGNLTTGFRFVDRFERRDSEWRIARRVAVTEWSRIDDPAHWWPVPDTMLTGRRDRSDVVYDPWEVSP